MPQPDLMLLKPREDSLTFDQGAKRAMYARHGVTEYWVADIPEKCLHVYLEPTAAGYAKRVEYKVSDVASPHALPGVQVVAGTLFF